MRLQGEREDNEPGGLLVTPRSPEYDLATLENLGHGRFSEVTEQAGTFCSFVEVSRGYAHGDLDNDGDLDIVVTSTFSSIELDQSITLYKEQSGGRS